MKCKCGCGESVSTASFKPGHDQKLRISLEQQVGGLEALRELVESAVGSGRNMKGGRDKRVELLNWYEEMLACVAALPPGERAEFEEWDKRRPAGFRTSDWPGFEKLLPKRP